MMTRFTSMILFLTIGVSQSVTAGYVDFNIGNTGTISYVGGPSPLTGSNIAVTSMEGQGTAQNNNIPFALTNGSLSFSTGNLVSSTSTEWTFGPGGYIDVYGPVPGSPQYGSNVLLFGGIFTGNTEVDAVGNGDFKVLSSGFQGGLSGPVTNLYGLPSLQVYNGAFSMVFTSPGSPGQAFTSEALQSGNLAVDIGYSAVPEPSSLVLFGIGGVSALAARRKMRRFSPTVTEAERRVTLSVAWCQTVLPSGMIYLSPVPNDKIPVFEFLPPDGTLPAPGSTVDIGNGWSVYYGSDGLPYPTPNLFTVPSVTP